jgi:hypothetical protein
MFTIMFALHLLFVIFTIGPLIHITATAARGIRHCDAAAAQSSARGTRTYAYSSILAVIFGFAVMSSTSPFTHAPVASFSDTWIWLSLLLWLVALALALAVTAPTLGKASKHITDGHAVTTLKTRVATSGSAIGLIFAAIVFLMVYQPGG